MICWDRLSDLTIVGVFEESEVLELRENLLRLQRTIEPDGGPRFDYDVETGRYSLSLAIGLVLSTLPVTGGRVELPSVLHAEAWLQVLADLRVSLVLPTLTCEDELDELRPVLSGLKQIETKLTEILGESEVAVPFDLIDSINSL